MTGAVNIITKPPRQSVGTTVSMSGGWIDRDAGSTVGQGPGTMFGTNATISRAPTDRLAYRISAGYFQSDAFPRPTGRVPVIEDPRLEGATVGGAPYPLDGAGPFGAAFANRGTSQPKFDVRVDQELSNGGQFTYSGGVAATEGLSHTGVGPFDIQRGSYLGYGKLGYTQGDFRFQVFTNIMDGDAPHLLAPPPCPTSLPHPNNPGQPVQLRFKGKTFDADRPPHVPRRTQPADLVRRNIFDITSAPDGARPSRARRYAGRRPERPDRVPPLLPPGLPPAVARGRCSSSTRRSRDRFPATVSPGRRGGRQRRPYRGRP